MNKIFRLIKGLGSIVSETMRNIENSVHEKNVATNPRHDDVYVVSFPKSGATWMEFLLANTNVLMSNSERKVTFYNIHHLIPDIHVSRHLAEPSLSFPGFRLIKSHSDYNPFYKNVIYVVRDPRDVMVSYYNFLSELGQYSGSLSELIRSEKYGVIAWKNNVEGWLDRSPASLRFMMVRYEDLKSKCETEIARLYEQLGFSVPGEILNKAADLSSFSNMKALETSLNYGGRPIGKKIHFMRKGDSGAGKSEMSKADNDFIVEHAGDILNRLGYL